MAVLFVAAGDVLVDVSASGTGHHAHVRLVPGGTATNAALEAARAGADAAVLGRIGDDPAGRMVQSELERAGIETSLSVDPELATGTFLLVDGEIRVDRGANAGLRPTHLPEALEGDVTLVSGHLDLDTVTAALERSRASWNALALARLDRLPDGGNAVFVDDVEARRLTGASPQEAARLLGERYRLACVTLGVEGAIGVLDGVVERAHPASVVAEVGFGAGDAFAAAVLVALASGSRLPEALAAGCRAGALVLSGPE
jgi:sugar/nucleoside kinase (ribokinase family)